MGSKKTNKKEDQIVKSKRMMAKERGWKCDTNIPISSKTKGRLVDFKFENKIATFDDAINFALDNIKKGARFEKENYGGQNDK